jgi:MYXO-CTERM domain-containing protein
VRISGGRAAALCAAATLTVTGAAANGRYPASTQIAFSTDVADPDLVVVRATYGLLVSRDDGSSWRWLCESALGVPTVSVEDPSVALAGSDALVVGLVEGLEVSQDASGGVAGALGCNFACIGGPLASQSIVDLAGAPRAPDTVLALSSSYVFDDAGAASLDTRVWETSDDGVHWTQRGGALDPTVTVTTLDVAASDPARLYVSGTRGFGAARTASLFVSTDGGETWTERPVPFDPTTEVSIFIGGVDPNVADTVYVRSSGVSRLRVTRDAGRSFQVPLTLTGQMLGFAIAPDGSKVYAGSVEDGILVGATAGTGTGEDGGDGNFAFRKVSSIHVQCLATRGTELWACSDASSGFAVGVSTNDGSQFAPRLQLDGLASPIACAPNAQGPFACGAVANASQCVGAAFQAVCTTLGGCAGADADAGAGAGTGADGGAPGLTSDASTEALRTPTPSCGCSAVPGDGSTEIGAVGALAAVAARRRRRRSD